MAKSRATDFSDPARIVGYDVEVEFQPLSGKRPETRHWLGSQAACRRKAGALRNFKGVLSMKPVTARAWLGAYGYGRM